jgi:diacylglycerol O-acyltransferase
MGNQDALMWCVERDPVLRSTTAAVTLLERAPERAQLRAKLERATRELPRLRQRVATPPRALSTPVWETAPHFDLDYHLRFVRAPGDASLRAVLDLAAGIAMQGFDRVRPLWEFSVVEDLEDGGAAVIQKLHHSVTDGLAGILLMQKVYDFEPSPAPTPEAELPADEDPSSWLPVAPRDLAGVLSGPVRLLRSGASGVLDLARTPLETTQGAASGLASLVRVLSPDVTPLSPIMRARSTSYRFETFGVPLASLKNASHAARCKLNDAFLAAVTGGFRRYHLRHGVRQKELRVSLPISLRGAGPAVSGNQIMPARFAVPVSERDPRRRMRRIRRLVDRQRNERALAWAEQLAGLTAYLPAGLVAGAVGAVARGIDFVGACVSGLPVPLYLAGSRVTSLHTFGPPAGTAVNVTLFSYLGEATVAINADPAAVPDHDVLAECMREGFDEVLKVG